MTPKFCILTGNPLDGMSIIGPFDSHDEARDHAEMHYSEWMVTEMVLPSSSAPPLVTPHARAVLTSTLEDCTAAGECLARHGDFSWYIGPAGRLWTLYV